MSIQISVTIWTVICFCVLMLVLNKLLFRPMLAVMDARREKIERARREREERMAAHEKETERILNENAERVRLAAEAGAARTETLRQEAHRAAAEQRIACAAALERERTALGQSVKDAPERLERRTEEISSAYAKKLMLFFTDERQQQRDAERRAAEAERTQRNLAARAAALQRILAANRADASDSVRHIGWTAAETELIREEYTSLPGEEEIMAEAGLEQIRRELDTEAESTAQDLAENLIL